MVQALNVNGLVNEQQKTELALGRSSSFLKSFKGSFLANYTFHSSIMHFTPIQPTPQVDPKQAGASQEEPKTYCSLKRGS